VVSGALTLSLLVLPLLVMASQEALRAVPDDLRRAAYALGATRWQVIRHQVLPAALPGILTGVILAIARAAGETAPLVLVGAVGFIAFAPESLGDPFTVLPLQIFSWITRPQPEFRALAAAAIVVLLVVVFALNAVAVVLRSRSEEG
jgi:phosphate transport system permease protein